MIKPTAEIFTRHKPCIHIFIVNKIDNGGSDDGSITWLEYIIDLENQTDTNALSKKHYKKFADQHYSADEIG